MPSIPQSLLWISLVVLWLFVLVPMLVSKRDAVRRTSDVALATRVLNSGARPRLLKRSGPAAGHRSDPDWKPRRRPTRPDEERDDSTRTKTRARGDDDADTDELSRRRPVVMRMAVAEATEPDYLDVDVVEDSDALPVGASACLTAEDGDDRRRAPSKTTRPTTRPSKTRRRGRATVRIRRRLVGFGARSRGRRADEEAPAPCRATPRGGAASTRRPPPRSAPANTPSANGC